MGSDIPPEQLAPRIWTRERVEMVMKQLRLQGMGAAQIQPPFPVEGWDMAAGEMVEEGPKEEEKEGGG